MIFFVEYDGNQFKVKLDNLTVEKVSKIDCNSFDHFSEIELFFKILNIKIFYDDQIVFDAEKHDFKNLHFSVCNQVVKTIKSSLSLSETEAKSFANSCLDFIQNKNSKIPYELMLAYQINNKTLSYNLTEFSNLEMKSYEKIQIALKILNETSEN
jgi:hypothetical protein